MHKQNHRIENLKIILIFCVILGHLLETVGGGYNLYKVIYSFHMPMFLFINGWLAPRNYASKRTVLKLIYPYILFQILYQLFHTYIISDEIAEFSIQFSTPYWLLWYLLSLIFYYLFIPVIATESKEYAKIVFAGTVILAIAIGFDNSIGYYMSLSRTFVFFPFFVSGYYIGHNVFKLNNIIQSIKNNRIVKILSFILAFIICVAMYKQNLNASALYGSLSYQQGGFSWSIRLEMVVIAFLWIGIFMVFVPDQKIFERVDTFPIYVLHGFIILYLRKYNLFIYSFLINLFIATLISIIVILACGNKYMSRMAKLFFRGEWVVRLWEKFYY